MKTEIFSGLHLIEHVLGMYLYVGKSVYACARVFIGMEKRKSRFGMHMTTSTCRVLSCHLFNFHDSMDKQRRPRVVNYSLYPQKLHLRYLQVAITHGVVICFKDIATT